MHIYIYIYTSARLNSHHGAAVTSRVAGATKNSSHITTLKSHHGHHFLKEFIAGANESSKSYLHIFFGPNQEILARARSSYAIFERKVCIIHSRLHWGAGFDRLVVYASIIAVYIGALALKGRKLRINHSRLHWGAGFDRLVVYASIIAVYIEALALKGGKLRINHSRLHWGAGFDRLLVYASIIAVYIGALALTGC